MQEIWFWQEIVSPHMSGLAVALAGLGCQVTLVAEHAMTVDRARQGWSVPALPGVNLVYAASSSAISAVVNKAPANAVHVCQGVRSNELVGTAQRALAARGLRQWVVMETVNDAVWYGALKRLEYGRILRVKLSVLQGLLAIGHRTTEWLVARGVPPERVYPFAYFLPDTNFSHLPDQRKAGPFRFVFVGRLISLKRVDWLISGLAGVNDPGFELWIVGAGPEEPNLRASAARKLGDRVRWLGQLPMSKVPAVIAQADCLVLPSVHDGWGAVASEALMTGTPVICSDTCGVAEVVRASGVGGVFPMKYEQALEELLGNQLKNGGVTAQARAQLAAWAACLGANAGARYLLEILAFNETGQGPRPVAPWLKEKCQSAV